MDKRCANEIVVVVHNQSGTQALVSVVGSQTSRGENFLLKVEFFDKVWLLKLVDS